MARHQSKRKCAGCDKTIRATNLLGLCQACERVKPNNDKIKRDNGKKVWKRKCWLCKKEFYTDNIGVRLHDKCRFAFRKEERFRVHEYLRKFGLE